MNEKNIGSILVENKLATEEEFNSALGIQKEQKEKSLSQILLKKGCINDDIYLNALSKHFNLPVISLKDYHISNAQQKTLSEAYALKNKVLILEEDTERIKIAVAEPSYSLIEGIRGVFPKTVEFYLAKSQEIESQLKKMYSKQNEGISIKIIDPSPTKEDKQSKYTGNIQTSKTVQLVNYILKNAIEKGASDIHIEAKRPSGSGIVKLRIDGILKQLPMPDDFEEAYSSVVSRIKVLTNSMKIDEKVIPQDGSFSLEYNSKDYPKTVDCRVSTINSNYGECVTIRVLDQDKAKVSLTDLGFSDETYNQFLSLIQRPGGMVLVTGPTGSGKTTTLYATINKLLDPTKKILTAEDPIEYTHEEIVQTGLNKAKNVDFSTLIKSFLRQDPDIIMVGEIRDEETANTAIKATQTGHLLLSTLHTTNTTRSIERLKELKVDPATFLSQTSGIIGQRLIRTVCPHCMEEYTPNKEDIQAYFGKPSVEGLTFVRGNGCKFCDFEGYKGRVSLTELWNVTDKELSKIKDFNDASNVRLNAIRHGLKTFYVDGIQKLKEKKTTLNELLKTVPDIEEDRRLYNTAKIKY